MHFENTSTKMIKIFYFFIGFYLLVCLLLYFFQTKLIFFPEKLSQDYPLRFEGDFEERYFQADELTTIHALHFYAENPKGVILYFHGNAGSLKDWGHVAPDFVKLGYDVLISDFRAYGKSTGEINEQGFYDDAQMLYDFLLSKYQANEIIIYGRSLGTGVATDLASKNSAQQLILETPFMNFANLAQSRFKIFPVKLMLQYQFANDKKIGKVNYPIHIFHGKNDEVIPYQHAQDLAAMLSNTSSFTTLENGNHNNLSMYDDYWKKIKELLK